jgi:hypothetical protein
MLKSVQVVIRTGPLWPGAADALLGVRHLSVCLIYRRHPSGYISFCSLNIRLRNGSRAD